MLVRFLANAAAIACATWLIEGIRLTNTEAKDQVLTVLAVALIFGLVNSIVKPLFTFAAAPLVLLSLGVFLMVINGLLMMLTSWLAGQLGLGWTVDDFWSAFLGALLVSVVSFIVNAFFGSRRGEVHR